MSACRVAVELTVTAAERATAARLKRCSTGWFRPKTSLPCTVDTTGTSVPRAACTAVHPCGTSQCAETTSYFEMRRRMAAVCAAISAGSLATVSGEPLRLNRAPPE